MAWQRRVYAGGGRDHLRHTAGHGRGHGRFERLCAALCRRSRPGQHLPRRGGHPDPERQPPQAEHEDKTLPAGGLITGGEGYRYDGGGGGYHIYYYYGGGVYVEAGASFVLAGGTIYACGVQSGANQAFGGGIYAEAAPSPCPAAPSGTALSQPITVPAAARSMPRPAPSPCPAASSAAALPWAAAAS